jgi:hypothetical protein
VSGLAFVLRAFGTWWIPLLLAFGPWRHVIHREPLGFAAWPAVFAVMVRSFVPGHGAPHASGG